MNSSDVLDIYIRDYNDYCELVDGASKYEWVGHNVFNLTTYDGELDELFGKKIIEVIQAILDRRTFEYIGVNDENYIAYIIVCQLLNDFKWIDWGTSIRGAWIENWQPNCKMRPILEERSVTEYKYGILITHIYLEVRCTEENLRTLIKFINS